MTVRKWAVRFVLFSGALLLSLGLIAFLAVQIQQRMLRWRSERLLADMHRIRLYQTNWDEAQRLMRRWGRWGYYEGSCTAASCKYVIELDSVDRYTPRVPRRAWLDWLLKYDRLNLYQWFGGRMSAFRASFTVHDGTIWREETGMGVSVPRKKMRVFTADDFEWTLSVGADSRQSINASGYDTELAKHPYYQVWRPDGCKILCQIVSVHYSTRTPPAEIERLTSYDFSCFTRFKPCVRFAELLPAAEEWHVYDSKYESGPTVPFPKERPLTDRLPPPPSCDKIPVWTQARDAGYVMAINVISTKIQTDHEPYGDYHSQLAEARVVDSLKEPGPWQTGTLVKIQSDRALEVLSEYHAERMVPGRRYLVFVYADVKRVRQLPNKDWPMVYQPCWLREDTPEVRRELEKGFAQNDTLRP